MVTVTVEINMTELEQEIDTQVDLTLDDAAQLGKQFIQEEVPVDTGLLRDSVNVGEKFETENERAITVGCDEGICYYAPFVYYPGVTRNYGGNQFIDRATDRLASEGEGLVETLDHAIPEEYKSENVRGKSYKITK